MNILRRLTLRDLKLNKKRTIGTLVGIILSCALIIVVLGMASSLFHSILQSEIKSVGYYHIEIDGVGKDDIKYFKEKDTIKDVIVVNRPGYINYDNYGFAGNFYSLDRESFEKLGFNLIEGDYPKNNRELLIDRSFQYEFNLKVGDYYDLTIGDKIHNDDNGREVLENTTVKRYKVVGISDKYNNVATTGEKADVYNAYLVLKNPKNYKKDLAEIVGGNIFSGNFYKYENFTVNITILLLETLDVGEAAMFVIMVMIGTVLFVIMVTSIFSISNSFLISISEKMKTYGMLSSIGATKSQIIKMVLFEGLIIGVVGVSLGILLGIGVNRLLVYIINLIADNANLYGDNFRMLYKFSLSPILMSIVLSFIVIILSSLLCALKASKVSPIQNIRNADNIKRSSLKTPKLIRKIFGIGGVISYKNLKRSKKKYRVTVISLTICIFIYIVVSTFVEYTLNIMHEEYSAKEYNLQVNIENQKERDTQDDFEEFLKERTISSYKKIKEIESLGKAYTRYEVHYHDDVNFENHVISNRVKYGWDGYNGVSYRIYLYNDNAYKEYIKKLDLKYDDVKDKLIVINYIKDQYAKKRNEYITLTDYKEGDFISLNNTNVEIASLTKECPIGVGCEYISDLIFIGNYENCSFKNERDTYVDYIYFDSNEPYKLAKSLKELSDDEFAVDVYNYAEAAAQTRAIMLIISIMVYGFIIVVTFIGVTSVFNTINSNMDLRSKDFASLKSIGMTKKEFNNMINLEAIFYSLKSLFYGVILGLIGSYILFYLFSRNYIFEYKLPIKSIVIVILFIIIIILIIMRYSIKKINKQNIIETIRNSNI